MYRHGDVLIAKTEAIPQGASRLTHCVLAEGELTGHSHRIAEKGTARLFEAGRDLFLEVFGEGATVVHQEHHPIRLPPGNYRVWRQREYTPQEVRVIRD